MKTQDAIQRFLHSRRALNRTDTTLRWYQWQLEKFAQFCPKLPTKPELIEDFLATITGAPETKHSYYRTLKAFYRFASPRYGLPDPIEQIAPPSCPDKIMPTLEPLEIMRLLDAADNLRDRAILTLLVDTGTRVGEIIGLRKQDIKTDTIQVTGKTGQREIPISEETRRLLLALVRTSEDEYILHGHKGRLSRHGVYRIVLAYMKKAGIQGPKLGPHRIRHAFGKNYLVNGGDLRSLQLIMGHKNIAITEKYAALTLSDIITKHNKFTPLRATHAAAQGSFLDIDQASSYPPRVLAGEVE